MRGFDVDEVAHCGHIRCLYQRCLVVPAVADEVDDGGNVVIAQMPEARHGKGHDIVPGVRHAAAFECDLNDRLCLGRCCG